MEIQGGLPGDVAVGADGLVLLLELIQPAAEFLLLPLQLPGPLPLPLVLSVLGQNALLPLAQVLGGHHLLGRVEPAGQLLGVLGLLVVDPPDG